LKQFGNLDAASAVAHHHGVCRRQRPLGFEKMLAVPDRRKAGDGHENDRRHDEVQEDDKLAARTLGATRRRCSGLRTQSLTRGFRHDRLGCRARLIATLIRRIARHQASRSSTPTPGSCAPTLPQSVAKIAASQDRPSANTIVKRTNTNSTALNAVTDNRL